MSALTWSRARDMDPWYARLAFYVVGDKGACARFVVVVLTLAPAVVLVVVTAAAVVFALVRLTGLPIPPGTAAWCIGGVSSVGTGVAVWRWVRRSR